MPPVTPSTPTGRPVWLVPVTILFLIVVLWAFVRQRQTPPDAAAIPAPPPQPTTPIEPAAPAQARSVTGIRPPPDLAPAPEPAGETPAITPALRQERVALYEKLSNTQDPTLAAVAKAFEVHGIRQPDVLASGWILAQNWAVATRAEAMVEAKVEDPKLRQELAEVRQRILIRTAEGEVRGLLGTSVDSRLLNDIESVGRALKDSPPPAADLLPNRAEARARRDQPRPPRPDSDE